MKENKGDNYIINYKLINEDNQDDGKEKKCNESLDTIYKLCVERQSYELI